MALNSITLPAFAKINLGLRVFGRRPDGYHEIDSILQTISLRDSITVAVNGDPTIVLSTDDRSLPAENQNLVWRAATVLQERAAIRKGAHIRLEKRIPVQAGLGGGSADAAVTLAALTHLWGTRLTPGELLEIAGGLGADVPFFFYGGTAHASGTGKEISPLADAPEFSLLIIKPNADISTQHAYETLNARALTTSEPKTILSSSLTNQFFDSLNADSLRNDFEAVVFQLLPEIGRAKAALQQAGARTACLAGSGSAMVGIFDNKDAQKRAIQIIKLEAGWRVFPCKTVGRSVYRDALGEASEVVAHFSGQDAGA